MSHESNQGSSGLVVAGISAIVVGYVIALSLGIPQYGTKLIVDHLHDDHSHSEHDHDSHDDETPHEESVEELDSHSDSDTDEETATAAQDASEHSKAPPFWTVIPFVLLLGAIAVFPLVPSIEHWWEENSNRFKVAASLGLITLLYYLLFHGSPVDGHWPYHYTADTNSAGMNWDIAGAVLGNALLSEFIPFIVLLFSLFTVSGGIRIAGDLRATPMTNAAFMAVGGLLASFIGTTGAAMLLIRPLLETNRERSHVVHTVVFFIFIVCNCGGCLLPIGDPPLFLGYLQGVSFTWTMFSLWQPWLITNAILLGMYLLLDEFGYYRRESVADLYRDMTHTTKLTIEGLALNLPLLVGVVLAVALLDPTKTLPGTDIHPWIFSREVVQLGLVGLSLWLGSEDVRQRNAFNYHAIVEVAALFCGIFVCMQPALQILEEYGGQIGTSIGAADGLLTPMHYYFITGGLSSVLDNAPTYLVFFKAAEAADRGGFGEIVAGTNVEYDVLVAISLGAVFMGAMTYIGNGPNFMVRAIAEKSGVRMPSFFGYVGYSVTFLLPVLVFVAWMEFL